MPIYLLGIFDDLQTSAALASILYQLSRHPEKQQKLREEIRTVLPNKDTKLTSDKLEQLQYLKACIKETMRFKIINLNLI